MERIPLGTGQTVMYLDSRTTPGGELGAMDVIEGSMQPSVLRTSDGAYIAWLDGHTLTSRMATLEGALNALREEIG